MSKWSALEDLLRTDPRDGGCAEAMAMLHVYVALIDRSEGAEIRLPGVAVHLRARGPCSEDYAGLLAAVQT